MLDGFPSGRPPDTVGITQLVMITEQSREKDPVVVSNSMDLEDDGRQPDSQFEAEKSQQKQKQEPAARKERARESCGGKIEDGVASKEKDVQPKDESINSEEAKNIVNRFAALASDQAEPVEEQGHVPITNRSMVDWDSEELTDIPIRVSTEVNKNATYPASKMERKAKEVNQIFEKAVVLTMVDGQQVLVVKHVSTGGNNVYATVSLLEKGHRKSRG
ncbi:hypothetical protein V6N12_030561 [Hibiscus sabdariffa]|uniref:Uncharacterized protein n=1 Tax=Hibiscus sabdariffa TaxID=183260 RepID=A0ABR2BC60_9ROSI